MEDVLAVYQRPYNQRYPQVCLDEVSKQLVKDVRPPLPVRPGSRAKQDYEYEREGVCNVFLACEALTGQRFVQVTARRTKEDWARFVRELIDEQYSQAEKIVLVMDNLNTHTPSSFYEVFSPEEAWRLSQKLEIHHTPKHGSWLNMAEIELSVLARDCLHERIASQAILEREVMNWQASRNAQEVKVNWRFTAENARTRLKRLYPSFEV